MSEIDEYLALIERERRRRPAEAMLADEVQALRAMMRFIHDSGVIGSFERLSVVEFYASHPDVEAAVERALGGNQEEHDRG